LEEPDKWLLSFIAEKLIRNITYEKAGIIFCPGLLKKIEIQNYYYFG